MLTQSSVMATAVERASRFPLADADKGWGSFHEWNGQVNKDVIVRKPPCQSSSKQGPTQPANVPKRPSRSRRPYCTPPRANHVEHMASLKSGVVELSSTWPLFTLPPSLPPVPAPLPLPPTHPLIGSNTRSPPPAPPPYPFPSIPPPR